MKRALIACGGTGGHLAPGIALAEELASRGWICELLISQKQVDAQLARKYSNFEYTSIPGSPFGLAPRRLLPFARNLFGGLRKCLRIIRERRPDVVIGFGGFLSASALFAGAIRSVPVAIHEANRVPGRATRLACRFADRVYLPDGVSLAKAKSKTLSVGMPLRSEIARIDKEQAKREFGFDPRRKLLVVFGGSQGALSLNRWVEKQREGLSKDSIQSLCVTGDGSAEPREWTFDTKEGSSVKALTIGFCDRMAILLSAADLVVSRSGAGSLAEIARCRTPSILIPYPYAADNHQFYNAERMVDQGVAHMLEHEAMEGLTDQVYSMLGNEMLLKTMEERMERMDSTDARSIIADDLDFLIDPTKIMSKEGVASA